MDRRAKVELFEQIRREYEHGGGTIRGIAKKMGIHRRMVREAVLSAEPVKRKTPDVGSGNSGTFCSRGQGLL